jgi:mono/diheme cytochrome c family protein
MKHRRWIFLLLACGLNACAPYHPAVARGADAVKPSVDINGRTLFLRNCAHCHGADARGDEGPDLHALGLADDWIANRIRQGKAGQMTAFAGKLQPPKIAALVAYVQSLK